MELALTRGISVAELDRSMGSRELSEWMEFDKLSPIGGKRLDYLVGMILAAVLAPYTKKGFRPATPDDLAPKWGLTPARKRKSPEDLKAALIGATVINKGIIQ